MDSIQSVIQNRSLIADQSLIRRIEEELSFIPNSGENLELIYLDSVTGRKWNCYTVDPSNHGGGTRIFAKLPFPDTEQLIDIVINSKYDDEVFAAGRTLLNNEESKGEDFRLRLIERLEQLNDKSKQISIIEYTDLDSPLNRRDVIGKLFNQVSADANYYKDIAQRAKGLMQ